MWVGVSVACPDRQPLAANRFSFFDYPGRLPHVEANFAGTYGKKDCHRQGRQKGLGDRRRQKERRELEGPAVPTLETIEPLDHRGVSPAGFGFGEHALQRGLRTF
jgi:hypothetical protein